MTERRISDEELDDMGNETSDCTVRALVIECERLRAMERRLEAWADEFERSGAGSPGSVGPFIAAELRNRMAGKP